MTERTWYSRKQGDPTPAIVMDVRAGADFHLGYSFKEVADDNSVTGNRDFVGMNTFRLTFSDTPGGAEIAGATLTDADVVINGLSSSGELAIKAPATKTKVLQTHLEGKGVTRRGTLYADLTGREGSVVRALWAAVVHVQFTTAASA